jgi:hypothetical protein
VDLSFTKALLINQLQIYPTTWLVINYKLNQQKHQQQLIIQLVVMLSVVI